jgi:type II secretion system protein H
MRAARRCHGFTLIELLVVVAIVAIVTLALALSVGGNGERRLAAESERLQGLLAEACDEAELGGRAVGVAFAADGYLFVRLDGARWSGFPADAVLRPRRWPAGLRADLERDGRSLTPASTDGDDGVQPQVVCFPTRELTPFVLSLALGDAAAWRVRGAEDAQVTVDRVDRSR